MPEVHIRFYEELNDFLPRHKRKTRYRVAFPENRSVKDLIESEGVPHTEVDLILVNGEPAGFDRLVGDSEQVAVYPVFETFDISGAARLGRPALREIRFVADVHLGKLVRRLRLLGFDCLYDRRWDDAELARISAKKKRILLTRDRGLLMRSIIDHGIFIRSDNPEEQIREVISRLNLENEVSPWSRCLQCNGSLEPVAKALVRDCVPQYTYETTDKFRRCSDCGKVYWRGTHWPKLEAIIQRAVEPNRKQPE